MPVKKNIEENLESKDISTVETKVVKEKVTQDKVNENLLIKLEEKDKEMAEMKAMLMQMQSLLLNNTNDTKTLNTQKSDEFISIYKQIPIVSLYNGTLNLKTTSANTNGKVYTFHKFGEVRNIIYNDIVEIIAENFSFAQNGYFYIMDEDVVREAGLTDYYKSVLTQKAMESIMDNDKDTIVDLFNSTNLRQRESLVSILVNKMANGEEYDLNKIAVISDLYKKDISVMAKDFKFIMNESKDVR